MTVKYASAAEAKVAKATERQPPPVLRQRTSELEFELLRRKKAMSAACSSPVYAVYAVHAVSSPGRSHPNTAVYAVSALI